MCREVLGNNHCILRFEINFPFFEPLCGTYLIFQEMLGNPAKARAIFERWMEWEPEDNAWSAYVKFEMRQEEPAKAR